MRLFCVSQIVNEIFVRVKKMTNAIYFYPVCGAIKHRASPKNRRHDKVLKKKKIMSVILAALLMMSLSSCGSSSSIGDEKSSASQTRLTAALQRARKM